MSGICSKHMGFVVGCPLCEAGMEETLVMWKADLEFIAGCAEGLTTTERHLKIAVDYALALAARLQRAEGLLQKCIYQHVPKNIPLYHMIKEALKDLGKEDRMTDSIDPIVRSLRHTEEIIAQGPNGPAWPDISPHQIKAEKE